MKQVFKIATSFVLALVVLFSTMSFTIDMHYCGKTLVDTAVFNKAHTCGLKMENPATKDCSVTKKNCCSNEQIVVDGQDELQLSIDKISFDQKICIATFVYTYTNLFEAATENVIFYRDYIPPRVVKTIYKLDETYLI